MSLQIIAAPDMEQAMQQPGVRHIDLGGLDLSLGYILEPGLQLPQDQRMSEDIEIISDSGIGDAKGPCEFGGVPDLAVVMSQHGPEASQGDSIDGNSQLRYISFEERADESAQPFRTLSIRT